MFRASIRNNSKTRVGEIVATSRSSVSEGDIDRWKEALKVVSKTNEIEYDKRTGEVAFREKIVEAVYMRVKPDLMWDDAYVQGKECMHDKIQEVNT